MNTSSNQLSLVSTTPAKSGVITAPTIKPKRAYRPNGQSRNLQQLASVWNTLDGNEQTSWKTLAGTLVVTRENGVLSKTNAFATFIQFNTMLQGSGNPISRTAPTDDTPAYSLAEVGININCTVGGGDSALVITAAKAYSPAVIVYAAKPLLAGANTYPKSAFKRIGYLGGLTVGANPIGNMYLAKYRIPSVGFEIALKLVGVMDSGRHTPELLVTCIAAE